MSYEACRLSADCKNFLKVVFGKRDVEDLYKVLIDFGKLFSNDSLVLNAIEYVSSSRTRRSNTWYQVRNGELCYRQSDYPWFVHLFVSWGRHTGYIDKLHESIDKLFTRYDSSFSKTLKRFEARDFLPLYNDKPPRIGISFTDAMQHAIRESGGDDIIKNVIYITTLSTNTYITTETLNKSTRLSLPELKAVKEKPVGYDEYNERLQLVVDLYNEYLKNVGNESYQAKISPYTKFVDKIKTVIDPRLGTFTYKGLPHLIMTTALKCKPIRLDFEDRVMWMEQVLNDIKPTICKMYGEYKVPEISDLIKYIEFTEDDSIPIKADVLTPFILGNYAGFVSTKGVKLLGDADLTEMIKYVANEYRVEQKCSMTPIQSLLTVLLRAVHYNTNNTRIVAPPKKCEAIINGKKVLLDFTNLDLFFEKYDKKYKNAFRLFCGEFSDLAVTLCRFSDCVYSKWQDIPRVPKHLRFDFVKYVDKTKLPQNEFVDLFRIIRRFTTINTPVRGTTGRYQKKNPMDVALDMDRRMVRNMTPDGSNIFKKIVGIDNV